MKIIIKESEPFQEKVKNKHKKMKMRLIGLGKNKHKEAGISDPNYERSKSAPIGEQLKNLTENLDLSSFKTKDCLYPKLWSNNKLKKKVKEKLLQIAQDFIDDWSVKPKIYDITITGSLANFNWSGFSDIDLHVIVDFKEVDDRYELVKDYFNSKKNEWNNKHDIKMNQHEVEVYVQHLIEEHSSTGVYSIINDLWVVKPQNKKPKIDERQINKKVQQFINKIDKIKELYDSEDYKEVRRKTERLIKKLKSFRQIGLEKEGEFSVENLSFKVLKRNGFIEVVKDMYNDSYDKLMGIDGPAKRDCDK